MSCSQHDTLISLAMALNGINITEVVEKTKAQLQDDAEASPAFKVSTELLLMLVVLLAQRLGLNS